MLRSSRLLFSVLTLVFARSAEAQVPVEGLRGHYPLNGNALDAGPLSNHGSVFQAFGTADRFGRPASAMAFNGFSSYADIPVRFDFFPRSIHFWFYTGSEDYRNWKTLLSLDNPALEYGLAVAMLRMEGDNRLKLYLSLADVRQSVDVAPQRWFHVAMCANADSSVHFYLNGKKFHSDTLKTFLTSIDGLNSLILGSGRMAENRFFDGKIDDLLIYDRCLTPESLDSIVNEGNYFSPLRIYPNPTSDILNIDCGGQFTRLQHQSFHVTNLLGQQLFSVPVLQAEFTIRLRERAAPGVYLVYFRDAAGQVSEVHKVVMP